jgi:hypothetical protein
LDVCQIAVHEPRKARERHIAASVAEARAAYADPRIRGKTLALATEARPLTTQVYAEFKLWRNARRKRNALAI